MTEKYADFHIRRLMTNFPTIQEHIKKRLNIPKIDIVDALSVDAKLLLEVSRDERIAV